MIPLFPRLPAPGKGPDWPRSITQAINRWYNVLARRIEDLLLSGTTAQRPTADGSQRFYYDTDTGILYYDSGVWSEVGSGTSGANASLGAAGTFNVDTYLVGSSIVLPSAGLWKAGTIYRCVFDMTKTAAGVATPIITVRMGTAGAIGDAAIVAPTFAVGTAAVDTGLFEVLCTFRSVGVNPTAVLQAVARCTHHLAATGLTTTGASGTGIIIATSAGFGSTTQTAIGLSVNGGAAFVGTCTLVQAELLGP